MKKENLNYSIFYGLLFCAVLCYLILRVFCVQLTHDELASFHLYIQNGHLFQLNSPSDANNHLINTFFSHHFYSAFGFSKLTLRITSLLSFFIYGFYVFKISNLINTNWFKYGFSILLLLPVNFIHFYALSRGYGISSAFLIGAIYFTLKLYEKPLPKYIILLQICAFLALLSGLSLMLVTLYIALFAYLIIAKHHYTKHNSLKALSLSFLQLTPLAIGVLFCLKIAFSLKDAGALYYGNLDGLWETTIKTIIFLFFEETPLYLQALVIIGFLIFLGLFIFKLIKDKITFILSKTFFLSAVLLLALLGIKLMALIMHVNYPEDRVGLYLFTFFAIAMVFLTDQLKSKKAKFILSIPLALFLILSFSKINLTHQSIWRNDNIPLSYYEKFIDFSKENGQYPIVSGYHMNMLLYYSKSYMNDNGKANYLIPWNTSDLNSKGDILSSMHPAKYADFIISSPSDMINIKQYYKKVDSNLVNNKSLYLNIPPIQKTFFDSSSFAFSKTNSMYDNCLMKKYDSVGSEVIFIDISVDISSSEDLLDMNLVTDIKNISKKESITYDCLPLHFLENNKKDNETWRQRYYLRHIPKNDSISIGIYFWNPSEKEYEMSNGIVTLSTAKNR